MVAVLGAVHLFPKVLMVVETKLEVALAAEVVVEAPTALVEAVATVAVLHLDGVSMVLAEDHL